MTTIHPRRRARRIAACLSFAPFGGRRALFDIETIVNGEVVVDET
jgi:hypothetical protein